MRKKSKYKPKPVLQNPLGFVLDSIAPITAHSGYLVELQLKNSNAMLNLMQGRATKQDMNMIIAMSNIVEALCDLGFGKQYASVAVDGREAIIGIVMRAVDKLRFVPTGPEIQALNTLMELHDEQMQIITVGDMDRAIAHAKELLRNKRATVLPEPPKEIA
jgi:hypothetical protein